MKVVREAYPDPTQFDAKSEYYDAGSTREAPRWFSVDVQLEKRIEPVITLPELREHAAGALREMLILKRGNRLSVTPLTADRVALHRRVATCRRVVASDEVDRRSENAFKKIVT